MSILADGRVAYLLRKPRRNGATHLVMALPGAVAYHEVAAHLVLLA